MKKRSDLPENWNSLREKIIGLGERSLRKSYYPELQQRLADLERFRALLDQSNDAIFLLQVPSGRFTDVNDFAPRVLHYSPEELSRMSIHDLVELSASERIKTIFSTGQTVSATQETIITNFRSRYGDKIPVEMAVRLVLFADTLYAVVVAREITERQRAEAALRASEEKYRLLVSNIPAIVFKGYEDGTVDFFDDKIETLLNYPKEEFVSRRLKWNDVILQEDLQDAKNILIRALKSDRSYIRNYRVKTKNQKVIWIQERGRIFCDQDDRIAYIDGVFFDVTERQQLEAQLVQAQKMEAVGRLAGGVAHDFNNLLTAILGYSEMILLDPSDNEQLHNYTEEIIKTAERAAALTRQLLAFGRKQIMQLRTINLNEVIAEMEKMLRRLLGEDVNLLTLLDPSLAPVKADVGQMEQVIMNLAVNARDAMPRGGMLTIETENVNLDESYAQQHLEVVPGPFVMLGVSDTGSGMDDATQSHIFEPFFTTKEPGKGTGLGLATVHGIVKQSGGHIWVYSELGHGTTFKIYLPRAEAAAEPLQITEAPMEILHGQETILVVEDDNGLRPVICQTLQLYGYTVLAARHGSEAILLCARYNKPIHLVLTDVVMPGMNGVEMIEKLVPLRGKMKVLFMSGYTEDTAVMQGLLASRAPFLEKPFKPIDLVHKVRQTLDLAVLNQT